MNRTIKIAVTFFVLQLCLVVALYFGKSGADVQMPSTQLFSFTVDAVTELTIIGPEKEQIVLQKSGSGWILPGFHAAPANKEQITALLAKLAALKQGFAVGTSAGAAKRFKVADDSFQRHVLVKVGDEVAGELYVGTSPGFRQIHARKSGSESVVVVELSTFELETKPDQWLDKDMFKIKDEDIESISFADFTLEKKDQEWQVKDLEEGQKTDAQAAADLVAKVGGLTIQTVVEAKEAEAFFTASPVLSYTVGRKGGGNAQFRLVKGEGDSYVLKQSERDLYCKVHKLQIEGLLKVSRDSMLVKAQGAEAENAPETSPERTSAESQ